MIGACAKVKQLPLLKYTDQGSHTDSAQITLVMARTPRRSSQAAESPKPFTVRCSFAIAFAGPITFSAIAVSNPSWSSYRCGSKTLRAAVCSGFAIGPDHYSGDRPCSPSARQFLLQLLPMPLHQIHE